MKLFYSPFHGFIHKSLVVAHESGVWDRLEFVPVFPFRRADGSAGGPPYSIAAINPQAKVPTLALDDGTVLYGSQVIVEYLDSLTKGRRLFPADGPARWDALRRMALADLFFDNTVMINMEGWNPHEQRRMSLYEWLWPKVIRSLDWMEEDVKRYDVFDIGHVANLQALSYLDFSNEFYGTEDPLHPNYNWRDGRPRLSAWYEQVIQRPSVTAHFKKPYTGDQSPENCQAKVREVLGLQGRARA